MRQPTRPTLTKVGAATLAAPVKGWNAKDPLADMEDGYAVILDNWFPRTANVVLRNGYRQWATGLGSGNVDTLAEFGGLASNKLIAGANLKIYDVSSNGAATDITAGSAITSNQWNCWNFGKRLFMFNGVDVPRVYDGSTIADTTFTGPTQTTLVSGTSHKSRMYIIQKNTMAYWYGAVDAISGALTQVDLATIFKMGGNLQSIFSWPRESYNGPIDVLCFLSSKGELLAYTGSYPGDTAWALVGRYNVGVPIGYRCARVVAGDVAVITTMGLLSMDRLGAASSAANPNINLSDVINGAFNTAAAANGYGTNFGWDVLLYPAGLYLLINVPVAPGSIAYQYVMNTLTGAWCRYTGMNAQSWSLFGTGIYFGGNDGKVYQADYGSSDNSGAIASDMLPAYSYFGDPRMVKRFLVAKPVIESTGSVTFSANMQTDFREVPASSTASVSSTGSPWDTSPWDSTAWTAGTVTYQNTYGVNGLGRAGALRLRASTTNISMALDAVSLVWEPGGWL